VFADPEPVFRRWLANEERPGRAPATAQERLGRRLFMSMPCSGCHTIRGTPAAGTSGPDLTHLASRTTIGALTLDNTRSNLADWIQNSQRYKPGNKMPGFTLTKTETDALVAYLERLR
jgi:cytochrome c oxidase subunit II